MDDRWIIFLGDASLDVWRSWTGTCIYSLPVRQTGDGVVAGPILVNANREEYQSRGADEDVRIFEKLLDRILNEPERDNL